MRFVTLAGQSIRRLPRATLVGVALLVAVILAASVTLGRGAWHVSGRVKLPPQAAPAVGRITVPLPPPDLFRPLTPEEAQLENAKRAPATRPDTPAAAFNAKTDADSRVRAAECLTQAIYYEAASESVDGQRAVAQVVLNRVRHPAYPASVCGVVYQGSERTTGCQFSFTCDGSLRRTPASGLWQRARKLATDALAGKVFAPVGHATYYHADYVVPYWADSLDKQIQIGRHIFYRLRGRLGTRQAFAQRYRGHEPSPLSPTDIAVVEDAFTPPGAVPADDSGLSALIAPGTGVPTSANPVLADLTHGQLLADDGRAGLLPPLTKRPPDVASPPPCPASTGPMATKAAPTNTRLGSESAPACR